MLEFFRKYQTYFFSVITVVIIISFSFFGTYNTLPANSTHEQVVFTAIDGSNITRRELDEMVNFISTDQEDKFLLGGIWGPNFLNDGVIKKEILETGLGQVIAQNYAVLLETDLNTRFEKEKKFVPYIHPAGKLISLESAWTYVAPEIKSNYEAFKNLPAATAPEAFSLRTALFLGERNFPAPLMRQLLKYQQKQYSWLPQDPNLDYVDLSLFGYHTMDDWFGPRFMRLVAQLIINTSKIAEQKGYHVSKEEALVDLRRNAEISYQQNMRNPNLGVANSSEYFQEQLRRLSLDQNKAIKIWQQVLLFRRLFQEVGHSVFVDPIAYQPYIAYSKEAISADIFKIPEALRLNDFKALQKFEIYLESITAQKSNDLKLPKTFLKAGEVKKKKPELIKKTYLLEIAEVNQAQLQTKVSLKEMWNWQGEEAHWQAILKEAPILGTKKAATKEERWAALDSLDDQLRNRVDKFTRQQILKEHPEWIVAALSAAVPKKEMIAIRLVGGKPLFGLDNREELIRLLDKAPIGQQPKAGDPLYQFSHDNVTFYRIAVLEKGSEEEVLTFAEANKEGVLERLLERELESHFSTVAKPEWKSYSDAKTQVAEHYFEKTLQALAAEYEKIHPEAKQKTITNDLKASIRLYPHVQQTKESFNKNPKKQEQYFADSKKPFDEQWKVVKESYQTDRASQSKDLNIDELFALQSEQWSQVYHQSNGDLYFFQVHEKRKEIDNSALSESMHKAQSLIADEAQQVYLQKLIKELNDRGSISLDYLNQTFEQEIDEN